MTSAPDPGLNADLQHVFAPVRLRHKTLAARITFGAHTANMAGTPWLKGHDRKAPEHRELAGARRGARLDLRRRARSAGVT